MVKRRKASVGIILLIIMEIILKIEGTGDMFDYSEANLPLWSSEYGTLNKVELNEVITRIGDYAFYQAIGSRDLELVIPDSIKSIGYKAFIYYC